MTSWADVLGRLPEEQRDALSWFHERQGEEVPWPSQLPSGVFLVNRAKGIHKPAGWDYALSVREVLDGAYADREPVLEPDGSWTYWYYQEGEDPAERDTKYTNIGLMACMRDGVPVGVLRQVSPKPNPTYRVLGLAMVRDWEDGWFLLEGHPDGTVEPELPERQGALGADLLEDSRRRTLAEIVRRRGQPGFRRRLLEAYGGRCAITGCAVAEALDAAHIVPYRGEHTNDPTNGLVLRTDVHSLFDLGYITVDPERLEVVLESSIVESDYGAFAGRRILLPDDGAAAPSSEALRWHVANVFRGNPIG